MLVILGGLFACAIRMGGPPIPPSLLSRIHVGMPSEEVRNLLGDPEPGSEGGGIWYYSPWGNFGWVGIYFDEAGNVESVDEEKAW